MCEMSRRGKKTKQTNKQKSLRNGPETQRSHRVLKIEFSGC